MIEPYERRITSYNVCYTKLLRDGEYYTGNSGDLLDGTYKLSINATDMAGNVNSTESVTFEISTSKEYALQTENNENIGVVRIRNNFV